MVNVIIGRLYCTDLQKAFLENHSSSELVGTEFKALLVWCNIWKLLDHNFREIKIAASLVAGNVELVAMYFSKA
ncbi:hypothetical protein DS2_18925 [Catenovulum agarivorans DS-2]|uniref:Uncharacterized protein n=1 Tax=Catenovulum agarivorans DS-2 TaxID=1328313 RepID=W7QJ35_9ALTE|nr:hypothetical protein DS2_18925 [Catenovulum agarivorans DS-2]